MREKQYKYETTKLKLIEMAARLPAGTPLPNRNRLAEQCGVARITLERAISELIGEGILASYDGRGTYATGAAAPVQRAEKTTAPRNEGIYAGHPARGGGFCARTRPQPDCLQHR